LLVSFLEKVVPFEVVHFSFGHFSADVAG